MDKGSMSTEYLREIANHRGRVKYILYAVNFLQLIVAFLPIPQVEAHRIEIVILLITGWIYQFIYWNFLTKRAVTTSRQILLFSIPYTFEFTAVAYFSQNLLISAMLIMLVTTTMVFNAIELVILTLEDLLIVATCMGYDWWRGSLTPAMQLGAMQLAIIIVAVGLTASVATFEIKEKERRMVHLEELDRIKTTFLALVSHNLRTPIAIISGFLEVLSMRQKNFDAKSIEIMDGIKQNTRALNELVENTVSISQYQSGERQLELETFDLGALLTEAVRSKFADEAASKKLAFHLTVPPDGCLVSADKRQVGVALESVIGNAIKFTPLGSVDVSLTKTPEAEALVTVADTGSGIPAEYQDHMFSQFSRPGNILVYDQKGVGLGLYLAKLIVEAHHGKIWFESRENKGTSFHITLPLKGAGSGGADNNNK